jgi:hypothetical protein
VRRCSLLFLVVLISSCTEEPATDETGPSSEESADDGPEDPGCAVGEPSQVYRPDMVGCPGAVTQCDAHTLCAPGWHLCRTIEFEMAGGVETPATEQYWLNSCVRQAGPVMPTCPTASLCEGDCSTNVSDIEYEVTYSCNNAVVMESTNAPLGVAASGEAHKVGCDGVMCIFADAVPTSTPLGAVCCED